MAANAAESFGLAPPQFLQRAGVEEVTAVAGRLSLFAQGRPLGKYRLRADAHLVHVGKLPHDVTFAAELFSRQDEELLVAGGVGIVTAGAVTILDGLVNSVLRVFPEEILVAADAKAVGLPSQPIPNVPSVPLPWLLSSPHHRIQYLA